MVWTYDAGDGTAPVSVDFGKYDSEEALQGAVAEALASGTSCQRCESVSSNVAGHRGHWSRTFTSPISNVSPAPQPYGAVFYLRAMETDFGRDDYLGSGLFYYESRQGIRNLWKVALDITWGDQS